jgi:hypothetical protein
MTMTLRARACRTTGDPARLARLARLTTEELNDDHCTVRGNDGRGCFASGGRDIERAPFARCLCESHGIRGRDDDAGTRVRGRCPGAAPKTRTMGRGDGDRGMQLLAV